MSVLLEYYDVSRENCGMMISGMVRIDEGSLRFSNKSDGKVFTMNADEVEKLHWLRMGNLNAIKVVAKDGIHHRFIGFPDADFAKIQSHFSDHWKKNVEVEQHSIDGWNHGEASVEGQALVFRVNNKLAFEIPLSNVSQVPPGDKSETILEFYPSEVVSVNLVEMRFYSSNNSEEEESKLKKFREAIVKYVEGEAELPLCTFEQIRCVTPRARYDIKVYSTRLVFHGKTFSHKVLLTSISRLFILPQKDKRQVYLVLGVSPPIRQGQTNYHYIVTECLVDSKISLKLTADDERLKELCTEEEDSRVIKGRLYEVLSKVFRSLTNARVSIPVDMDRESMTCTIFECSYGRSSGFLYPLAKAFMYVYSPPMCLRFDEIANVRFARSDATTRSFDFEVVQRDGSTFYFGNIAKEDYSKLFSFVEEKGLTIRNS